MSFDMVACAFCTCFFKGKNAIVPWLTILWCTCSCFAQLSSYYLSGAICQSVRDAVTGPILSLTTNHMCSSHSLGFGFPIQWSGCRNCFWLCLLLLSTLHLCRFPFHTKVMILTRSYYRLSSCAIRSVDGCFLYIIIHNSTLHRTWL